jgi:AcrR family transcriptional regulator
MARPRSEDKRDAILSAAIQVIAEQGIGAPTSRIARVAGVAEGTLFTYFDTKDALFSQLYLEIKAEMREVMMATYPKAANLETRTRHVWNTYVNWGVAQPDKRRTLAQLSVSGRISEQVKIAGMQAFADVHTMIQESIAKGALRDLPPAFITAILGSLADTTMDFIARDPAQADRYRTAGFEAFWHAIVRT